MEPNSKIVTLSGGRITSTAPFIEEVSEDFGGSVFGFGLELPVSQERIPIGIELS